MNQQMEMLANLIVSAKHGRAGAVSLLRAICKSSADKAPADDLIRIAQFLYDIRAEAAVRSIEQN